MRASVRIGIGVTAASLALAHVPAAAQEAAAPANSSEAAVGPAQLKDFSLSGTVIRRAEPAPQPGESPAVRPRQPAGTSTSASEAPRPQAAREVAQRQPAVERPVAGPASALPPPTPARKSSAAALELGRPSPAEPMYSPAPVLPGAAVATPASQETALDSARALAAAEGSGFSPLPWALALLLAGVGGAYYFRRQRSGLAFAGAPGAAEFAALEPAPQRVPARPAPAPAPAPPPPSTPAGVVSTRLRPWLDIRFRPDRLILEPDKVTVEFEVLIYNSGSGPARDVLVEAAMFNAGPDQDKEIGAFFANPVGRGDRVPLIEPLKSLGFRSALSMPRDQLRQFRAGQHIVFVPLVGLNALYRWSGGEGQTSACCLVGKATRGEKLAPFRADQGQRIFTGLDAREVDVAVRN